MSLTVVRNAIIDVLKDVPYIGIVEGRQGRKESLPWFDSSVIMPLWNVTCISSSPTEPFTIGGMFYEHVFRIQGFYPHNFEADSDSAWLEYLDKVKSVLSPRPAIPVCAATTPPTLQQNDFVMYGDVLCHYAVFNFRVTEWEVG